MSTGQKAEQKGGLNDFNKYTLFTTRRALEGLLLKVQRRAGSVARSGPVDKAILVASGRAVAPR